ncbi:hypothetical protein ACFLYO_04475 [Chloroflexota bacterium]
MQKIRSISKSHPNITMIVALLMLFGFVQLVFGSRPTPLESTAELNAMLTDGQPTVVEFYSNL